MCRVIGQQTLKIFDFEVSNTYTAFQKKLFLTIYEAKWGRFKLKYSTLKVLLLSRSSSSKQIWIRSFKWSTVCPWRSKVANISEVKVGGWKNPARSAGPRAHQSRIGCVGNFLSTSNFDLWYFCSLLTYKSVQYFIWKIWFISFWEPEAQGCGMTFNMCSVSSKYPYLISNRRSCQKRNE